MVEHLRLARARFRGTARSVAVRPANGALDCVKVTTAPRSAHGDLRRCSEQLFAAKAADCPQRDAARDGARRRASEAAEPPYCPAGLFFGGGGPGVYAGRLGLTATRLIGLGAGGLTSGCPANRSSDAGKHADRETADAPTDLEFRRSIPSGTVPRPPGRRPPTPACPPAGQARSSLGCRRLPGGALGSRSARGILPLAIAALAARQALRGKLSPPRPSPLPWR